MVIEEQAWGAERERERAWSIWNMIPLLVYDLYKSTCVSVCAMMTNMSGEDIFSSLHIRVDFFCLHGFLPFLFWSERQWMRW